MKNYIVYSDKFILNVIDLKHIELATEDDKTWSIDYWARLFTATTWEELKMIADENIYMEAASQTMYEMSADELVKRQCRARRDYYKQMNSHNRTIRELEEAKQEITEFKRVLADKDTELNNAHSEIESLQKRIAELESQQK